jgi:hypothetical protein
MAGCGSDSKKVSLAPAQNTVAVMAGDSVYVGFKAENTEIVYPESLSAGTFKPVGRAGANFKAASADDTPLAPGSYTFSVKASADKNKTADVTIIVTAKLEVTPATAIVKQGKTQQFTAAFTPTSSTTVTWSVSPSKLGSIDSTGLFKAAADEVGAGRVTASFVDSTSGKTLSTFVNVTVPEPSKSGQKPVELVDLLPYDDSTWLGDFFGGAPSTTGGLWSLRSPGQYDGGLDALNIPENAYVYAGFALSFNPDYSIGNTPKAIPEEIDGYIKKDAAAVSSLNNGEWAVANVAGNNYVIIVPAYEQPAELSALLPYDDSTWLGDFFGGAPSTTGGLWSLRIPNAYDPSLNALQIPENAYVYAGFTLSWKPDYSGTDSTPKTIPEEIDGYVKKDAAAVSSLNSGQWAVANVNGSNYVILVPGGFVE